MSKNVAQLRIFMFVLLPTQVQR